MGTGRVVRHLTTSRWTLERTFDAGARRAIQEAVTVSEAAHRGEIRFAVEARLDLAALVTGKSPRERALDVFASLRVWDTEENSGILIYVLLADRRVEIVVDRGYRTVAEEHWVAICARMEEAFLEGHYREGAVRGVLACARHAGEIFPSRDGEPNELPDAVVFL